MKFLLILTLIVGGYREESASVTSVGPFDTQEACLAAGNAWMAQNREYHAIERMRAQCVRTR